MKKKCLQIRRMLFACVFLLSIFQQGAFAQKTASHVVGGTITNEKGETLQGVVVEIKNTTTRTVTDALGKFSITVKDKNAVLVISYTGYADKEVAVTESTNNINASLAVVVQLQTIDRVQCFTCPLKMNTTGVNKIWAFGNHNFK